jgi:hypothetical protein
MASHSLLSQIVGSLISAAEQPRGVALAVAYSVEGETPELLAPPERLAVTADVFAEKVLGALLDQFGAGGATAVGVLVSAAEAVDGLEPCYGDRADGFLVCAAERGVGGAASAGLFRPNDATRWQEAHADASWVCAALRALVNAGLREHDEAGTFPTDAWDETQAFDDELS